ncbi:MAG: hypothetical protein J0I47_08370 [Sphingomonas sp.]|uniref:hypothetical protein n=1 Tax=Sphingomonas sp. TaxID=28214 RepID=UPI001AD09817|nr:hypothetical protein [Sphingomonas sp.]MBN8808237.1 hypothetical protein [Sphingomonas sp.]
MRGMMMLAGLAMAAPAVAQDELPQPPIGSSYIEATCAGGIAGRSETTRIMASGRVERLSGRPAAIATARVAAARYDALSRRLDRAGFDTRTSPRVTQPVIDGIDCSLMRVKRGVPHTVNLPQAARDLPRMRDLASITDDVIALGRDATRARMRPVVRSDRPN